MSDLSFSRKGSQTLLSVASHAKERRMIGSKRLSRPQTVSAKKSQSASNAPLAIVKRWFRFTRRKDARYFVASASESERAVASQRILNAYNNIVRRQNALRSEAVEAIVCLWWK